MQNRVLSSQDKGIQKSRIVTCLIYISLMRDVLFCILRKRVELEKMKLLIM